MFEILARIVPEHHEHAEVKKNHLHSNILSNEVTYLFCQKSESDQ